MMQPGTDHAPSFPQQRAHGTRAAVLTAGTLLFAQAVVAAVNLSPLHDTYTVAQLVEVNGEANVTAWLSSAVLLAIAAAAALAAVADKAAGSARRRWLGWALVAGFFVLLSVDEVAGLHELAGEKAHRFLQVDWLPSLYTWVLVAAPLGLVAAVLLIRWFATTIGLSTATGRLGLTAVVMWMAVPILEALDPSLGGPIFLSVAEETLEAAGEALLLAGVILYLAAPGRLAPLGTKLSESAQPPS